MPHPVFRQLGFGARTTMSENKNIKIDVVITDRLIGRSTESLDPNASQSRGEIRDPDGGNGQLEVYSHCVLLMPPHY